MRLPTPGALPVPVVAIVVLAVLLASVSLERPRGQIKSLVPAPAFTAPVPAPFEPVDARADDATGKVEAGVWGRRYELGPGGLPERITSQGVDLLLEPAVWSLETNHGALAWTAPELVASAPAKAIALSRGEVGPLIAESRTSVEFDGMIHVELELRAREATTLERVATEWVLPESAAQVFQHHLEYDYTRLRANQHELASSAGALESGARRLHYTPTLLLASRELGIEWWWPSNLGWSADPNGALRLERKDGVVRLLVEPVARPVRLEAGEAWRHEFAVFPMPMRPERPGRRSVRVTSIGIARRVGDDAGARYITIPFPGIFETRWHGLPASKGGEKQRELRARLRQLGIDYIPYGKLTATPSLHPTPLSRVDDWAATGIVFVSPGRSQRNFLEERGWKLRTPFGYAACTSRWDYFAWMLEQNLEAFDAEGLDGLYFDIGGIFEPCQRALPPDAPKDAQRWDYFNVRAFYQALYVEMKRRRPDALILIHTNGAPKAINAFVDYSFSGEALNSVFRGGRHGDEVRKNPDLYVPGYFDLPEGFLDALLWPRGGGATSLLPQVVRVQGQDPVELRRRTRELFSRVLVDDVHLWLTRLDTNEIVQVLTALDRFGSLDEGELHGWWEQALVRADPRLRITGYTRAGRLLMVIANWEEDAIQSKVDVDEVRLGWSVGRIEDAEARRVLSKKGSEFEVTVPARDFRIVLARQR